MRAAGEAASTASRIMVMLLGSGTLAPPVMPVLSRGSRRCRRAVAPGSEVAATPLSSMPLTAASTAEPCFWFSTLHANHKHVAQVHSKSGA